VHGFALYNESALVKPRYIEQMVDKLL